MNDSPYRYNVRGCSAWLALNLSISFFAAISSARGRRVETLERGSIATCFIPSSHIMPIASRVVESSRDRITLSCCWPATA